ncbi:Wzz/FepE/Etk N-terminal domain-containing protein [Anditalea andensis]|nr:Wzz/FepE/Etk N-terminal domain-containing protein [Anditalea andensis]
MNLIKMVLAKKRILLFTLLAFLFGGILLALTSPVEFESSAITISETEEGMGGLGQLGGLAGMAGINLPMNNTQKTTFSLEMYPDLVKSRSFLNPLLSEEFFFETMGKNMTIKEYYLQERPGNIFSKFFGLVFSIPSRLWNIFSVSQESTIEDVQGNNEENFLRVSSSDEYVISQLRKRISIDIDKRFMTLRVKSPEPLISAKLNNIVLDKLIVYATNYKTEKQRNNLEFIEDRTKEAEQNFKQSQLTLASFRDANQGMISQRARTREEFLQAEFNISFNVYNTLKQEVEQTRIQLKKDTPIFTTFEPAAVPLGKASPNTPLILIISIFLGLFVGMVIVLILIIKEFFYKSI